MADVLGGLNLTVGVLAALVNKQRTGLGEKVDVALVELCGLRYGEYHHDLSVYRPYPPADRQPL